ncbi:MAG: alpha/beta hydrolase-fold protein [Thermoplasmata archaeon]
MRLSQAWIVARHDIALIRGRKGVLIPLIAFPIGVAIGFPLLIDYLAIGGGTFASSYLPQLIEAFTFWFVISAAVLPTAIAAYCIVGGKVEKSLEPLLSTPTTDGEILLGKVLAQSGAFFWTDPGTATGSPTRMEEFASAPRRAIDFYLDAGSFERTVLPGIPLALRTSVRYLRDVLIARGYAVRYAEFEGGHDYVCWRGSFADGLLQLLGRRRRPPG